MSTSIHFKVFIPLLVFALLSPGCTTDKDDSSHSVMHEVEPTLEAKDPIMVLLSADQTGISFQNQIIETYENNITTNINMYNGGGLAVADINNDGLPDLYFIGSNGINAMYLNKGKMVFEDITTTSGLASEEGF
jgi:hypothetical protein